ncbi:hypothetical protein CXF92_19830 [Pseudomonas sp. Choline-3u-10]|jgi:hypothetical protein|nr:hypothetical protein [Pseudomonas sp.]PKG91150.1 hypothetical protein CXF92_19830 [Pseudomonas sp. Choline-3u-10]HBM07358.1 hypothetical protein [Pseudomonas sp.]
MAIRVSLFVSTLMAASLTIAAGTGPTHPEEAREHPLDTREPRQDVIESGDDSQGQPRPPTLEAPPEVPPVTPDERPSSPDRPDTRSGESDDSASAS